MAKTYSNQKVMKCASRNFNDGKIFQRKHKDAMKQAMLNLKNDEYKLWDYLMSQADGYDLALSQKEMESWGIKKDSYYRAVDALIAKGYAVPVKPDSNVFIVYEFPQVVEDNSQIAKEEEISQVAKENSQIQKENSQVAKNFSQIPQRNTINTTNTIYITTDETIPQEEPEVDGTREHPIVKEREWFISHMNDLIPCAYGRYLYLDKKYYILEEKK